MAANSAGSNTAWNRRVHVVATFFSYVYLLRVPILIGLILIALPPFAIWGPARSLLENLFVLTPANVFSVMIVALMLAWSLLVVCRVVLINGRERFDIDQWLKEDVLRGRDILGAAVPTLSLFVCACIEKARALPDISWSKWVAAAVGGALIAYVAGFFGLVISITIAPRYKTPAEDRFDIPFPFSKKILKWAGEFRLIPSSGEETGEPWAKGLPKDLQAGYLDWDGHLFPAHWLVFLLLLISVLVYLGVGLFKEARLGMPSSVPALSYVLIVLLVANWILSTIAFFLDRYRVPLLLPLILFCMFNGQFPQSDHYFAIRDGVLVPPVNPADALTARTAAHPWSASHNKNGEVVVVATAGGGIQAAGWTAKVLTGLQEECAVSKPTSEVNFANSIAAISAVSGGAVGTLFFVNAYDTGATSPGFHASPSELKKIVAQAETPALSDAVWAMVYVDPYRAFFPYFRTSDEQKILDRGFTLEQTWRNRGSIYAYLSNWRDGVVRGWRPAVIFNATIAETGQPFLLATTDFNTGSTIPARQTFVQAYPNSDLPVVTATRLAASFPYVSPAARPLSHKPEYHLVDGGYYDNFGVDSLSAWLDQALSSLKPGSRPDVLFIQIRSFPTDAFPGPTNKGWFYQSYAPIAGLMSVRTTAQLVRDRDKLELLQAKWAKEEDHVRIENAEFVFPGQDAPLSWQLTEKQKKEIDAQWEETLNKPNNRNAESLKTVRSFCTPAPIGAPAAR